MKRLVAIAVLVTAALLATAGRSDAQPAVHVETKVRSLSVSADGQWLAVGHGAGAVPGGVSVYSMTRRKKPQELPRLSKPVISVAFIDGGKYLAALDESSEVVAWSWPDMREVFRVNLRKKKSSLESTFHMVGNPQGPQLAWVGIGRGAGKGVVEVVELPSGKVVSSISQVGIEHQIEWSSDGTYLLLAGSAWSWDTFKRWKPKETGRSTVSPDGSRLANISRKQCGDIAVVELASAKTLRTISTKEAACPLFMWFLPDGESLAWLGEIRDKANTSSALFRWDARRDRIKRVKHGLPLTSAAIILPGGRHVALADGQTVRFVRLR